MDYNGLGSGMYGIDPAVLAGTDAVPLPDVSMGSPPMQPTTPTGNGSGQWIDTSNLGNLLSTGLNYAIQRDRLQMTQTPQPVQAAQIQIAQTQSKNSTLLIIGGIVLAAVFLMHKGG